MFQLPRKVATPLIIAISSFLAVFSSGIFVMAASFLDLPDDPLYAPSLAIFQEENIIIGDTVGGKPTGELRPHDYLKRSEFTKVAVVVRLLEDGHGDLHGQELNAFTLKLNTLLRPYYRVSDANDAKRFSDIPDKENNCAKDPTGCEPWYTQFINFSSSKKMIQGFSDGTFRPNEPIIRIHALKLAMVGKMRILRNSSRVQSRAPRCLAGTENSILENNGGSVDLLEYALMADKLDVFGNACQAFTAKGLRKPEQRAEYLQQPITRKELARYFALTTSISQLQLDFENDSTVDSKNQYIAPYSTETREEKAPLSRKQTSTSVNSVQSPNNSNTPEIEVIDNSILKFYEADIALCGAIALDRTNTKQMILDCVAKLKEHGKSQDEIESLLKKFGYWPFVRDSLVKRQSAFPGFFQVVEEAFSNLKNRLKKHLEEITEEDESFKIDDPIHLHRKLDEQTTVFKSFNFKKGGSAESKKSNSEPLYIFIHGWGNSPQDWAEGMAEALDDTAQILFLDWSKIVEKGDIEIAPYYEATWIDPVAEAASVALKKWKIDTANTTIIGHSLGAILAARLAVELEGVISTEKISQIELVALDPAASFGGYETNTDGVKFRSFGNNGLCIVADDSIPGSETLMRTCRERYLIEYDDPMGNEALDGYADFTMQEYANGDPVLHLYGYYNLMKNKEYKKLVTQATSSLTCSVISHIPYVGTALNATKLCEFTINKAALSIKQHNWVHETFSEILRNPFYGDVLSLSSLSQTDSSQGKGADSVGDEIHGIIYTEKENSKKIKYLKTEEPDGTFLLLGNTQVNKIECAGSKDCAAYGYHGADEFYSNQSDNNYTIRDFKENNDKDTLTIESGMGLTMETTEDNGIPILEIKYFNPGEILSTINTNMVTFQSRSLKEVGEWMSVADGSYREMEAGKKLSDERWLDKQEKNSIRLNR